MNVTAPRVTRLFLSMDGLLGNFVLFWDIGGGVEIVSLGEQAWFRIMAM